MLSKGVLSASLFNLIYG
ncbi:protein YchT [Escherichia coli]|nr:protein YchT [Escherichia coli]